MNENDFIAEVYRRLTLKSRANSEILNWPETQKDASIIQTALCYRSLLPANKEAAILDVGFGNGWFMAVCIMLGYRNIHGADFLVESKKEIKNC